MSYRNILLLTLGSVAMFMSACNTQPETDVFSLKVGDCFQDINELLDADSEDGVAALPVVDCGDYHDNEVFLLFNLDGGKFPGVETINDLAEEGCLAGFEGYVGTPYDESRYYYSYLVPTQETWTRKNDREVVCFLFLPDSLRSQGSARGAGN